jgi:hypothetical protein
MDFCPGKSINIVFTRQNPRIFSASSADGGQSSGQSFVHVTSAPAMIGYTRNGYARFFCSRDIGTGDDWLQAQNVSWFC